MSQTEIKVPNIGDFKDVEVIEVLVKEGDEVKKNDPLITIESDKSSVEIPSTVNGKIIKLNLKIGDKVSEGDNILQIEINTKSNEKPSKNIEVKKEEKGIQKQIKEIQPSSVVEINTEGGFALASPKTRKFARELGVNINLIKGSQLKGRVDETDIKNFISSGNNLSLIHI